MYPNLYCSRVKPFFYATGKSDYEFPFLFANPCLYPLSARPLSSDQIKEIDQTIPIPCRPKSWSSPTWIWFSRENRELQRWEPWKARSRIRKQKPRKPQEWRLVESRLLSFFAPFSLNDSFEFPDQKFYMSIHRASLLSATRSSALELVVMDPNPLVWNIVFSK